MQWIHSFTIAICDIAPPAQTKTLLLQFMNYQIKLRILPFILFFSTTILYANNTASEASYTTVVKNKSVIIEIPSYTNTSVEIGIAEQPLHGQVQINANQSITYQPKQGVCEEVDVFKYVQKNELKIDTVTIFVEILCENLTIMNGFDYDTEKEPTTFTIVGIENYPENSLTVFNDEGNQVYHKEGYLNDWDGRKEGEPLPEDVTYYYVLNDGQGQTYSGYLRIN